MSNIKELLAEAVEEFGDDAHNRFLRYGYVQDGACAWLEATDNDDAN